MILVTAANGKLGESIVSHLRNLGVIDVIAGIRNTEKYDGQAPMCRPFDYNDSFLMKQSLKGVTTLIFISGSSEVGERIKQHRKVIDACKASDVKYIVYTSFVTVTNKNSHFPFTNQHIDTENYLNDSGIPSVIIRNGYYMENLQDSILNALSEGKLVDATKEGVVAFVSRDDLACATAKISKNVEKAKSLYTFTGEKVFSMPEITKIIEERSGRSISFKLISVPELYELYISIGLPKHLAIALSENALAIEAGEYREINNDLKKVLEREPQTLTEFITELIINNK